MNTLRGFAVVALLAGAAIAVGPSGRAAGYPAEAGRLKSISSRVDARGAALVIEANQPVPYLAMRPDPLTLVVDMRNVAVDGLVNRVAADVRSPITKVTVETVADEQSVGETSSRIRIALSEPVRYHVRSDRNTIVVDFDQPALSAAAPQAPAAQAAMKPVDPIEALGLGRSTPAASAAVPPPPAPAMTSAPAVVAPLQPQPQSGPQRRYTGAPVNFDFEDADLRGVLRLFQEISGLNIVIDPEVKGSVNLVLRNVPWDQALDVILKSNKLGYVVDDTIVRIAPLTSLADEEDQRRKLSEAQAESGELVVVTKQLSYAKAEELSLLLKSVLSKRGTVQIDPRTNTLIVTDLGGRLKAVDDLVGALDRAQPQVEIEARIVQTNKNYAKQLGVSWGFNGQMTQAIGNTTNMAFPNNGSLQGRTGGVQGPSGTPTAVSLPVGNATSGVGLALGSVNGAFNLDVALTALEQTGNGRVLSTPRVSTLNNVEAEMTQGVQIPLQTISNNTVTVQFKDAALTLKVKPQITAADTVIMGVSLENASPDFSRAAGPAAIPPINTQRAITTLLVHDGQTTVIGGIYTSTQVSSTDRTPGLGQIPLINWLFKRERVDDQANELLIFITPRIIK